MHIRNLTLVICTLMGTTLPLASGAHAAAADPDAARVEALSHLMASAPADAVEPLRRESGMPQVRQDGKGGWVIELGRDMLAPYRGAQIPAELDERLQAMRLALTLRDEQRGGGGPIAFRFGGEPLEALFAEPVAAPRGVTGKEGVDVFVSASHGYYFHHGFGDWRLQRPYVNGVVEDLLTPRFADQVIQQLTRQGRTSLRGRSTRTEPHPDSGRPWWQMASRYHAQALYPLRPDIWQSYADRSSPLREYNDDIRSRPLLANERGARALIHLHTNAAADAQARGMMAFVQPGRAEDRRLAHVLLCAVRTGLQATPAYASYRVRVVPLEGNYGENRLATAPSVLIEMGFHTNVDDAMALQDPVFQAAVATALAKGHAAFLAGEGAGGEAVCE